MLRATTRPLFRGAFLHTRRPAAATRTIASITRPAFAPAEGTPVTINIIKNEADPVIRPDAEYPAWLNTLVDRPSLEDLEEEIDAVNGDVELLPTWKVRLYMQRANKDNIKNNNEAGRGGAF